ncbi:MAG: hypothetical protein ACU837_08950 [Gammaproteobacteria bacterium]
MNQPSVSTPRTDIDAVLRYIYINEFIFIGLVVLCFIGEILAELSDRAAIFYWVLMIPVFFVVSLISDKAKTLKTGRATENAVKYLCIYWSSTFIAVMLVFLIWHSGTLDPESAALTLHIILAHTLLLSGITLGRRFYLIGIFLFATAAETIFVEGIFGMDLVLMIPVVWAGLHFEKRYLFPMLKKNYQTEE